MIIQTFRQEKSRGSGFFLTYLYLIMLNWTLNHTLPAKQSGFRDKSVIFVTSIPIPEAPMGRGWADIHMVKGVFVRFGFDDR